MDLIWTGTDLMIAGPDTGPVVVEGSRTADMTALRFEPGIAPVVFGCAADELINSRIALDDVWPGRAARLLTEQVASAADPAAVLQRCAADSLARRPPPRWLRPATALLADGQPVSRVADEVSVSPRQLQRWSRHHYGYGAKALARTSGWILRWMVYGPGPRSHRWPTRPGTPTTHTCSARSGRSPGRPRPISRLVRSRGRRSRRCSHRDRRRSRSAGPRTRRTVRAGPCGRLRSVPRIWNPPRPGQRIRMPTRSVHPLRAPTMRGRTRRCCGRCRAGSGIPECSRLGVRGIDPVVCELETTRSVERDRGGHVFDHDGQRIEDRLRRFHERQRICVAGHRS
ncbi:hypothetical protein ACVWY6_000933 [Williamsia sp. R60]